MAYEEYQDPEAFKAAFGPGSALDVFRRAGVAIDNLPLWDLEALIHILYNKFPHLSEDDHSRLHKLQNGVKRAVQTRFFFALNGYMPSEAMLVRNAEVEVNLNLRDTPFIQPPKVKKTKPNSTEAKTETSGTEAAKVKQAQSVRSAKPRSEFGEKVAKMELEELIIWALELGVAQEKIDKHITKPKGLAKMNISNMVRAKLPK